MSHLHLLAEDPVRLFELCHEWMSTWMHHPEVDIQLAVLSRATVHHLGTMKAKKNTILIISLYFFSFFPGFRS